MIVRVPGIGIQSAKKIFAAKKFGKISVDHLKKIGISYNKAKYFISCGNVFERSDKLAGQIKQLILSSGNSKYKPNFSPQLSMF